MNLTEVEEKTPKKTKKNPLHLIAHLIIRNGFSKLALTYWTFYPNRVASRGTWAVVDAACARARVAHLARITWLLPRRCFPETVADHSVRSAVCVDSHQPSCYCGGGWELFVKWSEVRARGCIHPPQRGSLTVTFAWSLSLGCNESVCWWRCAVSVVFLLRPSGLGALFSILMLLENEWFYSKKWTRGFIYQSLRWHEQ